MIGQRVGRKGGLNIKKYKLVKLELRKLRLEMNYERNENFAE